VRTAAKGLPNSVREFKDIPSTDYDVVLGRLKKEYVVSRLMADGRYESDTTIPEYEELLQTAETRQKGGPELFPDVWKAEYDAKFSKVQKEHG